MVSHSVTLYSLLFLLPAVFAALPKGWKACSRSANDYDACFKREVGKAISSLMNGNKQLGALPLDPLKVSKVMIPKRDGPVSIALEFKDVDITGLKDLKINTVKNDWKKLTAEVRVPDVFVIGKYKVDGKVLVLPIVGEGPCNLTLHDTTIGVNVDWKQIEKGGKKYFQMDKFLLTLRPKRFYAQLDNLFNGDKALGDNMNVFINENWDKILEEMRPAITSGLSQALSQISNTILSKIPTNEIDIK